MTGLTCKVTGKSWKNCGFPLPRGHCEFFTPVIDGTRRQALPYMSAKAATGLVPIKSTFCHTEIETAWTPHTEMAKRTGCKIHFATKGRWFLLSQFTGEPGDAHFLGIAHSYVLPLILGSSEIAMKSGGKNQQNPKAATPPCPRKLNWWSWFDWKGIIRVRDSSQLLKSFWSSRIRNKCHYLGTELLYFKVVISL